MIAYRPFLGNQEEHRMTFQRWGKTLFTVQSPDGTTRKIRLKGRDRWALECLIKAGAKGCTPIDLPGPRWSAYVFDLHREHGLDIETFTEGHGPPFDGTLARYVLRSDVSSDDEASA
jgi:hypothetical protein